MERYKQQHSGAAVRLKSSAHNLHWSRVNSWHYTPLCKSSSSVRKVVEQCTLTCYVHQKMQRFALVLLLFVLQVLVRATTYQVTTASALWSRIATLEAGDELIIRSGQYSTNTGSYYKLVTLRGNLTNPIRVYALPNETAIIVGDSGYQNVVNFDVEYAHVNNLRFTQGGRGVRIQHAIHSIFQNLKIYETGDVGLSTNDNGQTYLNLTLRGNEIYNTHGTGECFYLGCKFCVHCISYIITRQQCCM